MPTKAKPRRTPLDAVAGGIVVAISAGVLAGACPAARAARLSPADALRAS